MSLALKTEFFKCAGAVTYTNSTGNTITAGTPVNAGGKIGIAVRDIPDGATDELQTEGRARAVKANESWAVGDVVGYDSDGNPAVGTAGTGCWTKDRTVWDAGMQGGVVELAAAAGDEQGYFELNPDLRVAYGQISTVTASDTVVTGLKKVVSAMAQLESDPGDDPEFANAEVGDQAGTPAAGSILVKTWKNTGGTDPTPVAASTFTKKVNWVAYGY